MAHLKDQLKQLSEKMRSDQQFWMKQHGTLVGLTQELQTNSKVMQKLQAEYTVRCQTKVRLESTYQREARVRLCSRARLTRRLSSSRRSDGG